MSVSHLLTIVSGRLVKICNSGSAPCWRYWALHFSNTRIMTGRIPIRQRAARREKNSGMLGLFNDQRLRRDFPKWTRLSRTTRLPFAPDVACQLADTPVAHLQMEDASDLVLQRRGRRARITLHFFNDPLGNFYRDLGRLSAFASIHQAHPMASARNIPTSQSRDMLGVI